MIENNNAADPNADLSASSAAWKAILPNKSDDGYTLVAPGTPGTLHWNWTGSKVQLDTQCDALESGEYRGTSFKDLTANTERLPYVPHIVKELGLFPTGSDDKTEGWFSVYMGKGERFPRRGGYSYNPSSAGLGCVDSVNSRGNGGAGYGGRSRSLD